MPKRAAGALHSARMRSHSVLTQCRHEAPLQGHRNRLSGKRNEPRRVLFARAADASNVNAQAKNAQNILRHWHSAELRPVIFSFFEPDQRVADNPNVDIISIPADRLWYARLFAAYMARYEAVFCPGLHYYADWLALKLRALSGRSLPIIMTMEGLLGVAGDDSQDRAFSEIAGHPVYSQKISRSHWRRVEDLYRMANHVIAISPFLGRQARARYSADVSVLPLGVDVALFCRKQWARRERPRVVCAANVRAHKQPELFLALARRFPQADFVWFGEGELRQPLAEKAAREGIRNIAFPGVVSPAALAQVFAGSDIMVLPSRGEGVPKVTQEAAAAGLAQVIFGFYEAPSVVDGINGFVVWDEEEMAVRLGTLLADRDLTERMGRAGEQMAQAWSWEKIAPQWEAKIIESIEKADGNRGNGDVAS